MSFPSVIAEYQTDSKLRGSSIIRYGFDQTGHVYFNFRKAGEEFEIWLLIYT